MTGERRIVVYIATSADGYIARADGSVDWLDRPRPQGSYGMGAFMKGIDTVLWGRKTYMQAVGLVGAGGGVGKGVKSYVFSRQSPLTSAPGVEWVREPVPDFVRRLRSTPGKDVWMMGGGEIIASFLDADGIDEFMIHVVPVMIGEGIPLVAPRPRTLPLALRDTERYPDGVVKLRYAVERAGAGREGRGRGRRRAGARP
jgi:dihydrofolate reductase